jgi:Lysozyme like domain
MNLAQICAVARSAGFRDTVEVAPGVSEVACMAAIAWRESCGNPDAYNGDVTTGDRSYGLWQINMRDPNVARDVYEHIFDIPLDSTEAVPFAPNTEARLFDALTNAKAAWLLYGQRVANLDEAWYIARPGVDRDEYLSFLPLAQAAALEKA